MYLSHKGTFVATATIFALGLFITLLLPQNLSRPVTTGSSAQTPPASTAVTPAPGTGTGTGTAVTPPPGGGSGSTTDVLITCQMCDVDGSGTIDQGDINLIQQKLALSPGNAYVTRMLTVCTPFANPPTPVASCPAAPGTTRMPIPTRSTPNTTPGQTNPTGTTGQNGLGDCNSAQGPGQKDGRTDLLDFELLRQELSVEVQTTFCDFNANGSVDIIDFTDYLRKGFNS